MANADPTLNSYYLLEHDLRIPETSAIGQIPNSLEPLDWISGKKQPDPGPLKLSTSAVSGDFLPDMMGSLVTLFSTNLKNALTEFGVQNIDYFPVELEHATEKTTVRNYWLANITERIACIDVQNSVLIPRPSGLKPRLEKFRVDPVRAGDRKLFRLDEKPTLIVINQPLRKFLQAQEIYGVRLRATHVYDGY
jgi:hypothetical protein